LSGLPTAEFCGSKTPSAADRQWNSASVFHLYNSYKIAI